MASAQSTLASAQNTNTTQLRSLTQAVSTLTSTLCQLQFKLNDQNRNIQKLVELQTRSLQVQHQMLQKQTATLECLLRQDQQRMPEEHTETSEPDLQHEAFLTRIIRLGGGYNSDLSTEHVSSHDSRSDDNHSDDYQAELGYMEFCYRD